MRWVSWMLAACALATDGLAAPPTTPPGTAPPATVPASATAPSGEPQAPAETASDIAWPTASPPAAIGLRLASGERALPTRVYADDATVTLYAGEIDGPAGSRGSILRVGVDVYLIAEARTYSGHVLVPLDVSDRVGREAALALRRDLARFDFPGADSSRRAALVAAARFALARQPERLYAEDPASVAMSTRRPPALSRRSLSLGLAEPLVPLEQTRLRERLRREAVRAGHERLTQDPGGVSSTVVPGSSYFQRARRLGPVVGLPGGPQRSGFGRR